ncbi:MAG: hypothetical protein U1E62_11025 [Alsobacter sp.]
MQRRHVPVPLLATLALTSVPNAPADAHDIYTRLRDRSGYQCCGGDDCEAIGSDFRVRPDGSVVMHSRRQGTWIAVAPDKITWLVVPGGEASEAHWCGRPRGAAEAGLGADQPDDGFWTYCAFVAPQGS